MSDPIDDLLAQLQSAQPNAQTSPPMTSQPPSAGSNAGSIDGLLDSLEQKSAQPSAPPATNPRFEALVHPPRDLPASPPVNPVANSSGKLDKPDRTEHLLADLQAIYQAQDQAVALKQQAEREAEARRQETLKRQRRGALVQQAETWLKNLDARSGEAAWFEEFAAKYSSRVEAVIDYLNLETD